MDPEEIQVLTAIYPEISYNTETLTIPLGRIIKSRLPTSLSESLCKLFEHQFTLSMTNDRFQINWATITVYDSATEYVPAEIPLYYECSNHPTLVLSQDMRRNLRKLMSGSATICDLVENLLEIFSQESIAQEYFVEEVLENEEPIPSRSIATISEIPLTDTPIDQNPSPTSPLEIFKSDPITDRKSVFTAYACRVTDLSTVNSFRTALLRDPRVANATHNIMAYRFRRSTDKHEINGNHKITGTLEIDEDYFDDGETAAGRRLLMLLQNMKKINVAVIVSRSFGGIKLGPVRFKWINEAAKLVLKDL